MKTLRIAYSQHSFRGNCLLVNTSIEKISIQKFIENILFLLETKHIRIRVHFGLECILVLGAIRLTVNK